MENYQKFVPKFKFIIMRLFLGGFILLIGLSACVPAKKYNELVAKEKDCQEALKKYKTAALDNGAKLETAQARIDLLEKDVNQLKKDTVTLGNKYRNLLAQYQHAMDLRASFEKQLGHIKSSDQKHLTRLQGNLEAKMLEIQHKEDELDALESKLKHKEKLLVQRAQRITELEAMISRQKEAVQALKDKIAKALLGFKDKGLTVEERNGKIYVSLAAKLLFASGSTAVSPNGKMAIIQLANALEGEEGFEVIVEGHTDDDLLKRAAHPKNNWELSVLRATSVVSIMLENSNVNPAILSASGRSKYHPVSKTDKAKNRRIEVIIAPNLNDLFQIIAK